MSRYEITVGQFRKFVEDTGYRTTAERQGWAWSLYSGGTYTSYRKDKEISWLTPGFRQNDLHPVVCVSWYDAVTFCNWLSGRAGLEKVYDESTWEADFSKVGFRLPTEAEWEYAARAGGKRIKYPWGNKFDGEKLNFADSSSKLGWRSYRWNDGYDRTSPIGSFPPNELGLYDMAGNVWEWCNDWLDVNYYRYSPLNNPTGPSSGTYKVRRGGSWESKSKYCRSCNRARGPGSGPGSPAYDTGFRIVLPVR